MFDSNFVAPVLPVGYSITEYNDEYYAITPDGGQIGGNGFYHYNEAVDCCVQHVEFVKFSEARRAELNKPEAFAWFDAHDHITKSICIPYIDLDGTREIVVYLEGEIHAWGDEVLKYWNGLGFDEAIPLDMAFLYR